tara:strand:- start:658 stop:858 length:201 start_codon:yes stop_codon:yes gene_type:complete
MDLDPVLPTLPVQNGGKAYKIAESRRIPQAGPAIPRYLDAGRGPTVGFINREAGGIIFSFLSLLLH